MASAGRACDEYRATGKTLRRYHQQSWEKEMDDVAAWVRALPKPAGIMACNDFARCSCSTPAAVRGVAVPEEVAVIGVDNEEVACEMANPPLSSVVTNALQIGYEAAAALDALMRGKKPPTEELFVPPTGIVTRRSTEVTAIADPLVARGDAVLRQHACEGINVDDLLRHVSGLAERAPAPLSESAGKDGPRGDPRGAAAEGQGAIGRKRHSLCPNRRADGIQASPNTCPSRSSGTRA